MAKNRKVVLTGATGFIGSAVAGELLKEGYELVVLSRNPEKAKRKIPDAHNYVAWQAEETGSWVKAIDGTYGVIHCAASSLFEKRYSKNLAQEALSNRIISTRGLVKAIDQAQSKPSVFINSSSQGIYGFNVVSDSPLTEASPVGSDHWAHNNQLWEDEARGANKFGVRTVIMRIGYVLGSQGGGLPYQVKQAEKGRSGISKPANAYKSWIHINDLARLYVFALNNEQVNGPMNCTAPNPVSNQEYARILGLELQKPIKLAPYWIVRLFVGKIAEVYSRQRYVMPQKALDLGFSFTYPTLEDALHDLVPVIQLQS